MGLGPFSFCLSGLGYVWDVFKWFGPDELCGRVQMGRGFFFFFFDLLGYGWVAVGFIFNWIGSSKHGGFNSGEWVTVFKTNVGLKNQT